MTEKRRNFIWSVTRDYRVHVNLDGADPEKAFRMGFDEGLALGLDLWRASDNDEYSQPMLKSEAARLFDKDWRTIERRYRVVELTTKYVRIHKEDLPPTVDTPKKIWQ